jgi:Dolichyl-phosphate-mannose-protein mannosyltransferase
MSGAIGDAPARWKLVIVCGLIVSTLGVLWVSAFDPIMGLAPDTDSGIFLYVGQQLLRGQALYRDLFDDKGPLMYLFNALGLAVGGGSLWGVYVLGIALLCLVVVLVFFGFQRRFGFRAGAAGALYCALLLGVFAYGNSAQGFVLLAQLTALFLLTRWRPDDPRLFPYVLLGLAGTAVFFIKMTGVGLWAALFAAETLIALKSSYWKVYRRHMASLAAGAGLGAAVVLSYLAATGALAGFFHVYFAFNAVYASQNRLVDRLSSLLQGIQLLGYVPVACFAGIWTLMLIRVASRWRRGDTPDLLMLLALIWLPFEFIIASIPGRGSRYFTAALPAMVLLFALACSEIARSRPWRRSVSSQDEGRRAALLGVFALVAAIGLAPALVKSLHNLGGAVVHHTEYARTRPGAVYAGSCYPKVVDYVRQNTQPGDYVLVWGDYSQATNFLANRRTPTRFVFQPYLYRAAYGDTLVREFLSDLQARPPVMIVDTSPSSVLYAERPSIAAVESTWPQSQPADFQAAWRRLGSYLRGHYRLVETLPYEPHWKVYVRM